MTIKKTNVVGLIVCNDEFLVIRRNLEENSMPGVWEMPCGGVEEGETKKETLDREVKEESGIDIRDKEKKLVMTDKYSFDTEKGDTKEIDAFIYKVSFSEKPDVSLSEEHIDYAWCKFNKEDLIKYFKNEDDLYYKRVNKILLPQVYKLDRYT